MTWVPYKSQCDRTEFKFLRKEQDGCKTRQARTKEKTCVIVNLPIFQQGCCKSRATSGLWEEGQHQGSGKIPLGSRVDKFPPPVTSAPVVNFFNRDMPGEEPRIHLALTARPCLSSSLVRRDRAAPRPCSVNPRPQTPLTRAGQSG